MADSRPALEVASEYGVMLLCGPDYENKGKIISHGRHLERGRQKVVGGGWGGNLAQKKFCHAKKIILVNDEMY